MDISTFFDFYLCLTEGHQKGYIPFHYFENCGFHRKRE